MLARNRAPKTIEGKRLCSEPECETVLSRYNDREWCALHAPRITPRTRGVKRED